MMVTDGDDDVYYYIGERLKLEGETENMGRLSERMRCCVAPACGRVSFNMVVTEVAATPESPRPHASTMHAHTYIHAHT